MFNNRYEFSVPQKRIKEFMNLVGKYRLHFYVYGTEKYLYDGRDDGYYTKVVVYVPFWKDKFYGDAVMAVKKLGVR